MDLDIIRLTYFLAERKSIGSIPFDGKIINMILLTKLCISFHSQVFNAFNRI